MKKTLAGILACLLALSACGVWAENTEENTAATINEAVDQIPITYDYDELNVAVTTPLTGHFFTALWGNGSSDIDVRMMIHGYNLVEWDMEKGAFVPDQSVVSGITAQKEENGDITFVMALYDDLHFSDGSPVTAWDYAFSLLLTMATEMKELGAAVKTPEYIAGYRDYISGKARSLSGVRVTADNILSITIDAEYLPFFYELGLLDCVPYPIAVIAPGVKVADDGNGVYLTNADPDVREPVFTAELLNETVLEETTGYRTHPSVCSGPYLLTSYEDGTAQFEINPWYKGNSAGKKPMIQKVRMSSVLSEEMAQAFKEGRFTLLNKVSDMKAITDCLEVEDNRQILTFTNYERSGLSFINFNTERSPMDESAVRKAISYLADRDGFVRETLGDFGIRGLGYFGIGQWMYLLLNRTVAYPVEKPAEDADEKTQADYTEQIQKWEQLSLNEIEPYELNPEKGNELLAEAGWNLNEKGDEYVPGTDKVRYKETKEGLIPLKLTLAYAEGSTAGPGLEGLLVQSLNEAGIELKVEAISADELLNEYYRLDETQYDMFFLATNFDTLYDPSLNFTETEDGHHMWKTSCLVDDELWELSVSMRQTEPEDILGYCSKWLQFQKRFAEQLPLLPVYSNVYFDFYPQVLHEYRISDSVSWPQAVIGAYLADYIPGEEKPAD